MNVHRVAVAGLLLALVCFNACSNDRTLDVAGQPSSQTSTLTATPALLVADGVTTSALIFTARDANGKAVSGATVQLSATGSANLFAASGLPGGATITGKTGADGVFVSALASTKAEAKLVTASIGSMSVSASVTFTAGAPSATQSSIIASPPSTTPGGNILLYVLLNDAYGNPVPGQSVTVAASGTDTQFASGTPGSASITGTTSNGGLFITSLTSNTAQVETVTATLAGAASALVSTSVSFVAILRTPVISLFAAPTQGVADNTSANVITATIKDDNGNALPGQTITLQASGGDNTFVSLGLTAGSTISGTSDTNGSFAAELTSSRAETKIITANSGASSTSIALTFVPGPPSLASRLIATPTANPMVADGTTTYSLTLLAVDSESNPISNQLVFITGSAAKGNIFNPNFLDPTHAEGTTDSDGTFFATLASTTAGTQTITAQIDNLSVSTTVAFDPGAAIGGTFNCPIATPTLGAGSAGPSCAPVVADGVATAPLTVTLVDANQNLVANAPVTFGISDSGNGAADTFAPAAGMTNDAGVLVTALSSTKAEEKTVTATVYGGAANAFVLSLTPAGALTASNLLFVAGPPVKANSSLAVPNSPQPAGSQLQIAIATLVDQFGNLVSGYGPDKSIGSSSAGIGVCISDAWNLNPPLANCGRTDLNGNYQASSNLYSTRPGTDVVTAAVLDASGDTLFTLTANAVFVPGQADAAHSSFIANPARPYVGDSVSLHLLVADAFGNIISNQALSLASAGVASTLSALAGGANQEPLNGTTDANGAFSAAITSNRIGLQTVTATLGSTTMQKLIVFAPPSCALSQAPTLRASASVANANVLAYGDFNGDGLTDIAAANASLTSSGDSPGIEVLLATGNGTYRSALNYPVNSTGPLAPALGVAVADFNHDGIPDLAALSTLGVSIMTGTDAGTFQPPVIYGTDDAGVGATSLAIADFNRDGWQDIAVISNGVVEVFNGTDAGTFLAPVSYSAGPSPYQIATADFNKDGYPDLAVNNAGGTVDILINSGGQTFLPASSKAASAGWMTIGDFNGDGKPDIATGAENGFSVLLGTGTGAFGTATTYFNSGYPGTSLLAAADFNHDGISELITAGYRVLSGGNSSYANGNEGLFADYSFSDAGVPLASSNGDDGGAYAFGGGVPTGLAIADFTGDGFADILSSSGSDQELRIASGNGAGQITTTQIAAAVPGIYGAVAVGDINHDGKQDLFVMSLSQSLGTPQMEYAAILAGDGDGGLLAAVDAGAVGCNPATRNKNVTAQNGLVSGDFNRDGYIDFAVATTACNGIGTTGIGVTVLLGNDAGTFRPPAVSLNDAGLTAIAALGSGNFNNDAFPDLAVLTTDLFALALGSDAGTFAMNNSYALGGTPTSLAIGDFDHDGKLDVAVANANATNGISIFFGDGSGWFDTNSIANYQVASYGLITAQFNESNPGGDLAFSDGTSNVVVMPGTSVRAAPFGAQPGGVAVAYPVGSGPSNLAVGDFDGDGHLDIVVTNQGSNSISVLYGRGDGTFSASASFPSGAMPGPLATHDMNGDGTPDIIVLSQSPYSSGGTTAGTWVTLDIANTANCWAPYH